MTAKREASDSGQISILVLTASIALLAGTFLIGNFSGFLIEQQRLNTKAESVALAGAIELEFNQDQACLFAQEFSSLNYGLETKCKSDATTIQIELVQKNPNQLLFGVFSSISASARAGIAND